MRSKATTAWFGKAAEDEDVVSLIVAASGPWSMAVYHTQQAAEKCIKAVLVENGIAPPKSHDLLYLLEMLTPGQVPPDIKTSAIELTPFAWRTRYPGSPDIVESDAVTAQTYLSKIKNWALSAAP